MAYYMGMENNTISGRYRHYKGNEYEVIGEGTHTETEEKLMIYRSVKDPAVIWVRPYEMFFEMVEVDGLTVPRFTKLQE